MCKLCPHVVWSTRNVASKHESKEFMDYYLCARCFCISYFVWWRATVTDRWCTAFVHCLVLAIHTLYARDQLPPLHFFTHKFKLRFFVVVGHRRWMSDCECHKWLIMPEKKVIIKWIVTASNLIGPVDLSAKQGERIWQVEARKNAIITSDNIY